MCQKNVLFYLWKYVNLHVSTCHIHIKHKLRLNYNDFFNRSCFYFVDIYIFWQIDHFLSHFTPLFPSFHCIQSHSPSRKTLKVRLALCCQHVFVFFSFLSTRLHLLPSLWKKVNRQLLDGTLCFMTQVHLGRPTFKGGNYNLHTTESWYRYVRCGFWLLQSVCVSEFRTPTYIKRILFATFPEEPDLRAGGDNTLT